MTSQKTPKPYINHDFINGETNRPILEKAMKKAIKNGWLPRRGETMRDRLASSKLMGIDTYPLLIYSHDFAKALWGNQKEPNIFPASSIGLNKAYRRSGWQYHLQQMVISENPVKYLGENI